jgi:hypothetical protein
MQDKLKGILVLTITAFVCSLLLYLVVGIVGGNIWKQYIME